MNTCIDAFKNLYVGENNSGTTIAPCCFSPTFNNASHDEIDFVHNADLLAIREKWSQGEFPSQCNNCKQAEAKNTNSRRIGSNQWYKDNGYYNTNVELIRLDYWVGDLCNLACVICGPNDSSVWKQELNFPIQQKKAIVNKFWKKLDLSNLKYVHLTGGEPLLSKEHVLFLEAISNKNEVCINYNTNGTILPSESLLNLWQQFKLVQIDFSVDDIGERYNYQRYPADWNKTVENLQWFLDNAPHNCMFSVNTVVSVLNQHTVENIENWFKLNFYVSKFTDPIEHRKQLCGGILSVTNKNLSAIKTYLDGIDKRRGTSWTQTFPELIDYLKTDK